MPETWFTSNGYLQFWYGPLEHSSYTEQLFIVIPTNIVLSQKSFGLYS